MDKEINITLDVQKPLNPQNAFRIFRGDNVKFNFTFKNGDTDLDTTSAVKSQVFAKKIYADGVHKTDLPIFSGEFTTITTATFSSQQTAGDAGNYLMAVILLDANDELITVQAVHLNVVENGYAGVYQPSPDFRDDVLDALAQAQAEAVKAAQSATSAQSAAETATTKAADASASASDANNSKLDAASSASTAAGYAENASISAENASNYAVQAASSANGARAQAELAATSAQTAQQAAAQATEISDPEGWRTNTRAMIADLANTKSNIGLFNFGTAGGCLQTTGNPMYGIADQSHCMTLELDTPLDLTTVPALNLNFCGDNTNVSGAGYTGVGLTTFKGSSDGIVRLLLRAANGTSAGGSFGNALFPKVFGGGNGEIPAGKYVMCVCIHFGDGTENDKSTAKIYINNALAYAYPESTTLTKDALIWSNASTAKLGFFDTGNYHLTDMFSVYGKFIGKASRFAVFNFDMSAAGAPYSVADYYNGRAIPVALQSSDAEKRCIVASADYAIARNVTTKLVKDITGNGNDLTVYGDVKGDKDAAIAAFVDELKTQISQQSTD